MVGAREAVLRRVPDGTRLREGLYPSADGLPTDPFSSRE